MFAHVLGVLHDGTLVGTSIPTSKYSFAKPTVMRLIAVKGSITLRYSPQASPATASILLRRRIQVCRRSERFLYVRICTEYSL